MNHFFSDLLNALQQHLGFAGLAGAVLAALLFLYLLLPYFEQRLDPAVSRFLIGILVIATIGTWGFLHYHQYKWDVCRTIVLTFLRESRGLLAAIFAVIFAGMLVFWYYIVPAFVLPCRFDSAQWKSSGSIDRHRMVADLLRRGSLQKLSHEQVLELLGEPDEKRSDTWIYFLSQEVQLKVEFSGRRTVTRVLCD